MYPSTAMGSTPGIGFAFNTVMPSVHALDVDAQGRILFVGQAMDASFSQRWAAVRLGSGAP